MRSTRPIARRTTVVAGAATLVALAALAAGPALVAAGATPSAQSEYTAVIKAVGSQGVHFASTASQSGATIRVSGDTGTTSGLQTLTVTKGSQTEHVSAMVVGSTGYIKGNSLALHNVIGLSTAQSSKYAGSWLSFPTSNSGLAELVSGLLNSQVAGELQISSPYSYGSAATVNGQHVLALRGHVSSQSGGKVPVVIYVPASGTPLPIEEVTNPGTKGGSSAIHGTVSFSNWGERTTEKAPAKSVSLLKLVPTATSGATSTTG